MKKIIFILIISLLSTVLQAQEFDFGDEEEKKEDKFGLIKDRLLVGGGFGLQIGTITSIELLPEVCLRIHERFHVGVGANYTFYKNSIYDIQKSFYGGKVLARALISESFFIQGEYELLSVPEYISTKGYTGKQVIIPGTLGGIGYKQQIGKYAFVMTSLLYNFTIEEQTPYYNPIFRIGFLISLESRSRQR